MRNNSHMEKPSMQRAVAALLCIVLLALSAGCAVIHFPLNPEKNGLEEVLLEGEGKDKILLLDISGFISDEKKGGTFFREGFSLPETIRESAGKARQDGAIRGLILRINSPGGSITASDILHHEILALKKERAIPVSACLMDVATSGAYYIATAADDIVAHPTTITGSFAVIAVKINARGLLEKVGIEAETFKSGELKDMGSPFRPSTPEERDIMENILGGFHERFARTILEGRNGLKKGDLDTVMDGRIFSADQALQAGLVDRIGYLEDGISSMKSRLGLRDARIVTYQRSGGYKGTIYSAAPPPARGGVSLPPLDEETLPGLQLFYLWMP